MAAIDYGTGANTSTGDLIPAALAKLRDRLIARGFDPGVVIGDGSTVADTMARIELALNRAVAAYVPPVTVPPIGTPGPTPTPTPTPSPSFTTLPSVSPASGTVGQVFTGADGVVANGTITGRRWLLDGVQVSTASTYVSTAAGSLALEVTALGVNGVSITATSTAVTVSASSGATFSRVATTQAADTSNNTALISALAANNARPSYTLAANTARTIAWKIGAVAAPGAFIAYIVDKSGYTAVAEQSADSTNGTDGTWTRLTDAIVFPAGGTSSQGAANTRQIAMVPAGAASWVRLTLTHTASANVFYPAVYQRPTSGLSNVWLGVGASLEGYGMWSKDMEDAMVAAYPAQDPVFLRYAVGGTTVSTIKNSPAEVAATHWANLFSYVIVGNAIGNDITNNQPISGTSQTTINTIRTNYDTLLNGFPGKIVFPVRTTYRAYSGVSPTAQAGGSLPFNQQIVDPSVAANQSSAYDSALAIPRVDLYSTALLNRGSLNSGDPVHYSTYVWYQAELVRTAVRFAYTGAWPVSFIETQVAKAESTTLAADINEAQYSINSLGTSSAKSALQARLSAIAAPAPAPAPAPASATVVLQDSFTVPAATASDTSLDAHLPEIGGAWTILAGTFVVSKATGKVHKGPSMTGYSLAVNATKPTTANYDIETVMDFPTVVSLFGTTRTLNVDNNVYFGYSASNGWTVGKRSAAANSPIGSSPFTAPAGATSYIVLLQVRGDTFTLLVDGVQKVTGTITGAAGDAVGIEYPTGTFSGSDTVGPQANSFKLTEYPA